MGFQESVHVGCMQGNCPFSCTLFIPENEFGTTFNTLNFGFMERQPNAYFDITENKKQLVLLFY